MADSHGENTQVTTFLETNEGDSNDVDDGDEVWEFFFIPYAFFLVYGGVDV